MGDCTRGNDSTPASNAKGSTPVVPIPSEVEKNKYNLEITTDAKDTDNQPSSGTAMMYCTREDDDVRPTNVMDIFVVSSKVNSTIPRTYVNDVNVSIQDTCSSSHREGEMKVDVSSSCDSTSITPDKTHTPNPSTSPNSIMVKGRRVFHIPGGNGAVTNTKLLAGKKFLIRGDFPEVEYLEKGDTNVICMIQLFGGKIISCFAGYPGKKSACYHWIAKCYLV